MNVNAVERVIFQYSDRCNMNCPYCYCPFIGERINPKLTFSIIDRCHEIGVKIIIFGGGDPFMYESFRTLIPYTNSLGIKLQIDTNGISMNETDYQLVSDYASVISLPLDGPDEFTHAKMRNQSGHFRLILNHLEAMKNIKCNLKINTVVSSINCKSLSALATLLINYPINFWSLFQFWGLGEANKNKKIFEISDSSYITLLEDIKKRNLPFQIEGGIARKRRGYHFFVMHTGTVYIHDERDASKYRNIGSIFSDRVIDEWINLSSSSIHPVSISRYKKLLQ